jgi:hypothetical protein
MSSSTLSYHHSPGKNPVTGANASVQHRRLRKALLVQLGIWGMNAGKRWVVRGVQQALQREGLTHE